MENISKHPSHLNWFSSLASGRLAFITAVKLVHLQLNHTNEIMALSVTNRATQSLSDERERERARMKKTRTRSAETSGASV